MVEENRIVLEVDENGERIDKYLSNKTDLSRERIKKLLEENILVNKKKVKSSYKVQKLDLIEIEIPESEEINLEPIDMKIKVYYSDRHLAVIEKKAGIPVHASNGHNISLVNGIMYAFKDLSDIGGVIRPGIVHRLDKDTSGLLIIAKDNETHQKLSEMFKNHNLKKKYYAIVKGILKEKEGIIDNFIGRDKKDRKKMAVINSSDGKRAISSYKVIAENYENKYSLVEFDIKTGRTHQIRVHSKFLNHPIVGDEIYGKADKLATRQMLHSYYLKFTHPITLEEIEIISNPPEDFKKVFEKYIGGKYVE